MPRYYLRPANGNDSNDGKDFHGFTLTAATFTTSSKNLNETAAFSGYTFTSGDMIAITGGTGVTVGLYEIASHTDDDNIVLVEDIGGTDPSDVTSSDGAWKTTQKVFDTMAAGDACFACAEGSAPHETTAVKIDLDQTHGTLTARIVFRGTNSNGITRLARGSHYTLQVNGGTLTNLIERAGASGCDYIKWMNIDFDGADVNTAEVLGLWASVDEGEGNHFESCRIQRSGSFGVHMRGSAVLFSDCEIDNNADWGMKAANTQATRWTDAVVVGCRIHDNSVGGVFMSEGARSFVNNEVFDNAGDGLFMGNATEATPSSLEMLIANNTFWNNTGNGVTIENDDPSYLIIYNNTFVDNGEYGIDLLTTLQPFGLCDYNHFSNNTSGAVKWNNAAITEANINVIPVTTGGPQLIHFEPVGFNNQVGSTAAELFVDTGADDFTPKFGTVLTGNGLNGSDIGARIAGSIRSRRPGIGRGIG